MPWCPKCKIEYREGSNVCSDCGEKLIDQNIEDIANLEEPDHEVFLISTSGVIEADVLESLLNANHIPVLRKFNGSGGYLNIYMGFTVQGIDIYVPSKLYEKAKEIIEIEKQEELKELGLETEDTSENKKIQRARSVKAWIILLVFMPGILIALIIGIFNLVKYIFK